MIKRITSGWHWQRSLFLVVGSGIIAQSILEREWIGLAMGLYFAAMGIFNTGCASGQCNPKAVETEGHETDDIIFEEIK